MPSVRVLLLRPAACVVLAVPVVGCGAKERGTDVVAEAASPPAATVEPGGEAGIVVDVAGAVRRPGVYRMAPGARVHEAIRAAGGARRGAQLGALNRAAVLVDGQQVLVGAPDAGAGTGSEADATGAAGASAAAKVNVNSADVAGLDALPGIGQVTAERIVASRDEGGPFASLDDLDRVPGIGPATIESMRSVATT